MISFIDLNKKMIEFSRSLASEISELKREIVEKSSKVLEKREELRREIDRYLKDHEDAVDSDDSEFSILDDKEFALNEITDLLLDWQDSLDMLKDNLFEMEYMSDKEIRESSIEDLNI